MWVKVKAVCESKSENGDGKGIYLSRFSFLFLCLVTNKNRPSGRRLMYNFDVGKLSTGTEAILKMCCLDILQIVVSVIFGRPVRRFREGQAEEMYSVSFLTTKSSDIRESSWSTTSERVKRWRCLELGSLRKTRKRKEQRLGGVPNIYLSSSAATLHLFCSSFRPSSSKKDLGEFILTKFHFSLYVLCI